MERGNKERGGSMERGNKERLFFWSSLDPQAHLCLGKQSGTTGCYSGVCVCKSPGVVLVSQHSTTCCCCLASPMNTGVRNQLLHESSLIQLPLQIFL